MKKIIIYVGVFACVLVQFFTHSTLLFAISLISLALGFAAYSMIYNFYTTSNLSKIEDPDIKIERYNKLISSKDSSLQKAFYLNNLSECYGEKEEYEKALKTIREARGMVEGNRHINFGVHISDFIDLNESHYLMKLGLLEEASLFIARIDESRIKNSVYLCSLYIGRANLAIEQGFSKQARVYLMRLNELDLKRLSDFNAKAIEESTALVKIKCDVLEKDYASAINSLNDMLESNTSKRNKEKAMKMKIELEAEIESKMN